MQYIKKPSLKTPSNDKLEPENFNATKLGKSLDSIHEYGLERLFSEISVEACSANNIDTKFLSLDTTSISLTGEYDKNHDEQAVSVTHGYSKDHRPDLKQIVHELLVSQDGGVPLMSKTWDGNESDSKIFQARAMELVNQLGTSNSFSYLVADSKLYSKNNASNLSKLKFITRIPNSIKAVNLTLDEALRKNEWVTLDEKNKYYVKTVNHYDMEQTWITTYSLSANSRAKKSIKKKVFKESEYLKKEIRKINKQQLNCSKDISLLISSELSKVKYHTIEYEIKPKKLNQDKNNSECNKVFYTIELVSIKENKSSINKYIETSSCYIIGSNIPNSELSIEKIINGYKSQNKAIENMGFRFLKDPIMFTSSLYVKLPRRIEGLLFVMTLSLLVYSIAQRKLRQALTANTETLPNQLNKPTNTPTLKWVFKLLNGINIIYTTINNETKKSITGINEFTKKIINLFGLSTRKLYGL